MKKKRLLTEIKVGIVIFLAIAILFYMSFRMGRFGVFKEKGYELVVYLDNAAGLDPKTPVKIAGVDVGRVKEVSLEEFKAKVILFLDERFSVPIDSKAAVRSQGILGDKFVEILPGKETIFLKEKDTIRYVEAHPDFEEIFKNLNMASKEVGETLAQFKGMVGESEKTGIKNSIRNLEAVSSQVRDLISENREDVKRVVENAKEISEKFISVADKTEEISGKIASVVGDIEKGKGTIGMLIRDDSLYKESKEVVSSLKDMSARLEKGTIGKLIEDESLYEETKRAITDMREIVEGIKKGDGTLGKLVKDEEIYEETKKTLKDIQKAARGMEEQTPISVLGTIMGILF